MSDFEIRLRAAHQRVDRKWQFIMDGIASFMAFVMLMILFVLACA